MNVTYWPRKELGKRASVASVDGSDVPIEQAFARISVLVLHIDPIVAAGLTTVLQHHGGFQILAGSILPASDAEAASVDVVLADYETALRLVQAAPQWAKRLLVFTNYDGEAKVYRALDSGVRGYLLHGTDVSELFDGISAVHRGGVPLSPPIAARVVHRTRTQSLTPRERCVLELLVVGLSNKAIACKMNLRVGTVKTHVKAIFEKLNANSRTAAVVTAQRRGLLA